MIITVHYKAVDGWHVFQSAQVDGLYVASPDLRKAYADVRPAVELLMKLNNGVECKACLYPTEMFQPTKSDVSFRLTVI